MHTPEDQKILSEITDIDETEKAIDFYDYCRDRGIGKKEIDTFCEFLEVLRNVQKIIN